MYMYVHVIVRHSRSVISAAGVSVRQTAEDGATPAHFAAASGQVGGNVMAELCLVHSLI